MQINVQYDSSVSSAPAAFKTSVQAAVNFLDATILDAITVNIAIGWGEVDGQRMSGDALGESLSNGLNFSYSRVRSGLTAAASSAEDQVAINNLPATDPTHGGSFYVPDALAAVLGLPQDGASLDGWIGISSSSPFTFDPNNRAVAGEYDVIGVLEHEITEVIGRIASSGEVQGHVAQYNPLDLFRYASPGLLALTPQVGYFSIDGGKTQGLLFNNPSVSDAGDWVQSVHGDAFGEGASGVMLNVSSTDLSLMDVIGYTLANPPPPPPPIIRPYHDFDASGTSDILFGQAGGALATWQMRGTSITGGGAIGNAGGTWSEAGIGDFNGDRRSDILFQDASQNIALWLMNGTTIVAGGQVGNPGGTWSVEGVGAFTGGTLNDILFQDAAHNLAIWEMSGTAIVGGGQIGNPGGAWNVAGIGDFNDDGRSDILFAGAGGDLAIWEMNGTQIIGGGAIGNPGGTWAVKGVGDFNADGSGYILFEDASGAYAIWEMRGVSIIGGGAVGSPGADWQFAAVGDYNGDGHADILFPDATSDLAIWEMNGVSIIGGGTVGNPGAGWHVLG